MSQAAPSLRPEIDRPEQENPVRRTVVGAGFVTLILACATATYLEFQTSSALMAMSNLPLAVLLPFVFWLLTNVCLKRFAPRLSLTTIELRALLSILWVGGAFIGYNWATQWVGTMAAPRYYASPENRWEALIFDHMPWWMYPSSFPGVVDGVYLGLRDEASIPWGAWLGPVFWTASAALAMTAIGIGVTAVFQKQWHQHERLTYPLAQVTTELTEGFDRRRGWPPFVKTSFFWFGSIVAALPLLWNIIAFWYPTFPRISIFDPYSSPITGPRGLRISRYLRRFRYRILPTVLGFGFLCELNILFSIWSLYLVGQVALYAMARTGFSVGLSGQEADSVEISLLFRHGAMVALAVWAVWISRGHLAEVFRQIRRPPPKEKASTVILSPRGAAFALIGGYGYMIFWLSAVGYDIAIATFWLTLFWASIFVAMKYLAASGFAYLMPYWGWGVPKMWVGTARMSESTLVARGIVNWRLMSGWRLPVALPHVDRLLAGKAWTAFLIFCSALIGLVAASLYTVWICYTEGGASFQTWSLVGAPNEMYNLIATELSEKRTVTDPGKIVVWLLGICISALAVGLQSWISWWPVHPMGLMMMFDGYTRHHSFQIFLVWLAKLAVLRFGGIGLYRRLRPIAYGLIVGYVFAAGCSFLVDAIWFPDEGHLVHSY